MPIQHQSPFGAPLYSDGTAISASVATQAALTALTASNPARVDGNEVFVRSDGSRWYWHSTSTLTADDILVDAADDAPAAGRWLRCPGYVVLECPVAFGTADGATILTIPTGAAFKLYGAHWRITTGFSGGSSSAIGIASSISTTAGDILGGAGGELTAAIGTAGRKAGTIGPLVDTETELQTQLYAAAGTFTFERITSVYTAGAGFACLEGFLIVNAGA